MHNDVIEQFRDENKRGLDYQNLLSGLYCFSIGLFKKVIIADTFANAVSWGFSNVDAMSSLDIFIVSLCYTFQLYFDFSVYCDMAIGTSRMFNIELPINFNSPYQSTLIIDFWGLLHGFLNCLNRIFKKTWETHSFSSAFKYIAEGIQYFYNRIYGFNLWAILLIAFFIVLNLKNTKQITYKRSFWRY